MGPVTWVQIIGLLEEGTITETSCRRHGERRWVALNKREEFRIATQSAAEPRSETSGAASSDGGGSSDQMGPAAGNNSLTNHELKEHSATDDEIGRWDDASKRKADTWTDTSIHPWRRFGARALDLMINGSLALALILIVLEIGDPAAAAFVARQLSVLQASPYGGFFSPIIMLPLAILPNAILIGLTGGTLGKWLFGVRIANKQGEPIGMRKALVREIWIYVAGFGFGIPLISLCTMLASALRLKKRGASLWDERQANILVHRSKGTRQDYALLVGLALLFGSIVLERYV